MQGVGGGAPQARALFGGSLSAVVPPGALDVSALRDVPDNQEVFAHPRSDQSLIVELLEYQTQVSDEDAARFHFEDVAGCNRALEAGACEVSGAAALPRAELALQECSCAWTLSGTQRVSKFSEEARNTVTVHLALFRLPQFSTDVLVTFNDPQSGGPRSPRSSGAADARAEPWSLQDFRRLLNTLSLHDPGLFGQDCSSHRV